MAPEHCSPYDAFTFLVFPFLLRSQSLTASLLKGKAHAGFWRERDLRQDKSVCNENGGKQVSCTDTFIMEPGCLGMNLS